MEFAIDLKPTSSIFCTHGVRHETMESDMDFVAWKIATEIHNFPPLQHIFVSLLQHEFQMFSTSFTTWLIKSIFIFLSSLVMQKNYTSLIKIDMFG